MPSDTCVTCKRRRGKLKDQNMSNSDPPFANVGLEVIGPWTTSTRKTRGGYAVKKRWTLKRRKSHRLNLKVGDVLLPKGTQVKRNEWPTSVIEETIPIRPNRVPLRFIPELFQRLY